MAGYIGTQAVSVNTTSATISDDLAVGDDLTVTDDATIGGTALVTGVLTTTAATVFNGGFASNAASTITTADNTTQLTLISTDADSTLGPQLNLYRNSASPADNDFIGQIYYTGRNDNSQDFTGAAFLVRSTDVSDGSEDVELRISVMSAGSVNNMLRFLPAETVFNEENKDIDFRVESTDGQHSLFVEGSTGNIGMFGDAGVQTIDHYANYTTLTLGNTTGGTIQFEDDGVKIAEIFNNAESLVIGATRSNGDIFFKGLDGSTDITALQLDMSDAGAARFANGTAALPAVSFISDPNTGMFRIGSDVLGFATAGAERVRIDSTGIAFHGDTATANHLNDYEEGTFTPSFTSSNTGFSSLGYSHQNGFYTKVGRKVSIHIQLIVNTTPSGANGDLKIAGLPFTGAANVQHGPGGISFYNGFTSQTNQASAMVYLEAASTVLNVAFQEFSGVASFVLIPSAALHNANPRLTCQMDYFV